MSRGKVYLCYEQDCPRSLSKRGWFLYYLQEISAREYPTFVDWFTDMLRMGLLVEEKIA